jgi:hypothetical protein
MLLLLLLLWINGLSRLLWLLLRLLLISRSTPWSLIT